MLPLSKLNRKIFFNLFNLQASLEAGKPQNTSDIKEIIAHQHVITKVPARNEDTLKNYRPVDVKELSCSLSLVKNGHLISMADQIIDV